MLDKFYKLKTIKITKNNSRVFWIFDFWTFLKCPILRNSEKPLKKHKKTNIESI